MFGEHELTTLSVLVSDAWSSGLDRDWTAPAGTLTWSCGRTAGHTVDTVFAPAVFLAARKQDGYPEYGSMIVAEDAPPADFVEALAATTRIMIAVFRDAEPDARALIWRRPEPTVRPPADFLPRAGLELLLHGHDVCRGLGVAFEPPEPLCDSLRRHTADWSIWSQPGWQPLRLDGEAFADLLRASGR